MLWLHDCMNRKKCFKLIQLKALKCIIKKSTIQMRFITVHNMLVVRRSFRADFKVGWEILILLQYDLSGKALKKLASWDFSQRRMVIRVWLFRCVASPRTLSTQGSEWVTFFKFSLTLTLLDQPMSQSVGWAEMQKVIWIAQIQI